MKKGLFAGIATLGLLVASSSSVLAEWKPSGPIKLMIAFAAGGGADTQARLIAEALEAKMVEKETKWTLDKQ